MANQARRVSGCVIAGMGIAILAVMATHAPPAKAAGPVLIRGPYLQSVTATSAIIVWHTDIAGDAQADYGVGSYTYSISDTTIGTEHVASLASLVTGTEVMYRILTNGTQLYAGSFRTAVDVDTTFSFAVLGDSGVGSTAQYSIANVMTSLDPMFVLHTGDVIYPSGQYEGYDPFFFAPYQTLLRRAPMFLSMGNHDYGTLSGQPYLDTFFLPHNNLSDTERYYSFDWGNAHFTAVDYNNLSAAELNWLQSDLSSTDKEWKFVFYHQAIYSSGPHGHEPGIIAKRLVLGPIFAANHVDIVFNGHDHDYERTQPITGVVYMVSGGGGNTLYSSPGIQSFSAYFSSTYHTVSLTLESYTLTLQAIDREGTVFDTAVLTHTAPQAPSAPLDFQVTSTCADPYFANATWSALNLGGSVQGYRIYQLPGPTLVWSNTDPAQSSVSQFVSITPNFTDSFQINAYNAVGESAPSNPSMVICLKYSIFLPIIYKDWND